MEKCKSLDLVGKTSFVRRYRGEQLPYGCRIAVIANDTLGNYLVAKPLLKLLRSHHRPSCIHLYSGVRTQEFWAYDVDLDQGFDWESPLGSYEYDLVVNIEATSRARILCRALTQDGSWVSGPCLDWDSSLDLPFPDNAVGALAVDPDWTAQDLVSRHPILTTGFIGEIFCRLSYLTEEIPSCSIPIQTSPIAVPDVLIAASASLVEKLWVLEKWVAIASTLKAKGKTVGLIGAKPEIQKRYWFGEESESALISRGLVEDLRGKLSLPQAAGALQQANLCLTLDNGVMHMACAVGTPTIALFREGFDRLWAPPFKKLAAVTPGPGSVVSHIPVGAILAAVEESFGN